MKKVIFYPEIVIVKLVIFFFLILDYFVNHEKIVLKMCRLIWYTWEISLEIILHFAKCSCKIYEGFKIYSIDYES